MGCACAHVLQTISLQFWKHRTPQPAECVRAERARSIKPELHATRGYVFLQRTQALTSYKLLTRLDLSGSRLGPDAGAALGAMLKTNTGLRELDVSGSSLGTLGGLCVEVHMWM